MRAALLLCALVVGGLGVAAVADAAPTAQYQVTRLLGFKQVCGGDPECPNRDAFVTDLNDEGDVVGYSIYDALDGSFYAALWPDAGPVQIAGALDGFLSAAYGINDGGLIVGGASLTTTPFVGSSYFHPFVNSNGTVIDLGQLPGDPLRCPFVPDDCLYHPAAALDVNRGGVVVGYSPGAFDPATFQVFQHAFVYANGGLTDLNSLIAPGGGWILERAERIADDGTIYGTGTLNGAATPFIFKSGQVQAGAAPPEKNAWGQYIVSPNLLVNSDGATHDLGTLSGLGLCGAIKVNDRGQILCGALRLDDRSTPSCGATAAADARSVGLSAQDALAGLKSVQLVSGSGVTFGVSAFSIGTWNPVAATVSLPVNGASAGAKASATDIAGNTGFCDPVALLSRPGSAAPRQVVLDGISSHQTLLRLANGHPGFTAIRYSVNGGAFVRVSLATSQSTTVDLTSLLQPGSANRIVIQGDGPIGARAVAIVSAP